MTRRKGASKSNSEDAKRKFASKLNVTQICGSHRKINTARDPIDRFGCKQVTRREGTSKSNWVDARRQFASKSNVTQMGGSHRKIDIARDLTSRFG